MAVVSVKRIEAYETMIYHEGKEVDAWACKCPVCGVTSVGRVVSVNSEEELDAKQKETNQLVFDKFPVANQPGYFYTNYCEHFWLYDCSSRTNYDYDATFRFGVEIE